MIKKNNNCFFSKSKLLPFNHFIYCLSVFAKNVTYSHPSFAATKSGFSTPNIRGNFLQSNYTVTLSVSSDLIGFAKTRVYLTRNSSRKIMQSV